MELRCFPQASPWSETWGITATMRTRRCGWRLSKAGFRGPTIINSGIIIGGFGGQFQPVPERESLIEPEYLNADTNDEIVKAVRRNILYGAKVIKICVDCKSYGYTADEMRLFISEAAKSGLKVAGLVQTKAGGAAGHRCGYLVH